MDERVRTDEERLRGEDGRVHVEGEGIGRDDERIRRDDERIRREGELAPDSPTPPAGAATLPIAASVMPGTPGAPRETSGPELLMPVQKRDDLRRAWLEVQSSFIDEPEDAVRKADGLVQELLRSVSERFDSARRELEGEWQRGDAVNTESLRLAFRRYRALFDRLLSF
jgi:hypothetical protein